MLPLLWLGGPRLEPGAPMAVTAREAARIFRGDCGQANGRAACLEGRDGPAVSGEPGFA